MIFPEFVAISLNRASELSMDYKAMSSFSKAIRRHEDLPMEDLLGIWMAAMIDKGISPASRKRYVEKLSTIYKDFDDSGNAGGNPFEAVRKLRDCGVNGLGKDIQAQCARLSALFGAVLHDAKTRPELALFLYMLFNASSDIEKAVSLRTEEYVPVFAQLNEIIDPTTFHHRRKYVFDLNQSRKRMPQLTREVVGGIASYLSVKGIKFGEPFVPATIVALWTAKARETGVSLSELRSVLDIIPSEYEYLNYVKGPELTKEWRLSVKKTVAEAFSPTDDRWYAMKLRRGISFENVKDMIKTSLPGCFRKITFFYPMREVSKRVGKKIVRDSVPYIADVVFMRIGHSYIGDIDRNVRHGNLGWVFRQTSSPGSDYSVIDRSGMKAFQIAVCEFTSDMKVDLTREKPVGIGRKVRITGGMLAGYTGVVYDIKDDDGGDSRRIYIRLSEEYGIRVELKIDMCFVDVIDDA